MPTITQTILRITFYGLSIYTIILLIKLLLKKKKQIKKGYIKDVCGYIIISATLLIVMGNIIIFNVDMYDSMLGTMEVHTAVYLLIILGGSSAVFFLHRAIKEL